MSDKKVTYKAILLKANTPDKNGIMYTEEALKKMAEAKPETLKYEHGCLYWTKKT